MFSAQPREEDGKFAAKAGTAPDLRLAQFEEPEQWPFDEYEMDTYTSGECYRLARALEQLGVGKLVAITTKDKPTGWRHMLVETDDGRYVDIEGIHTPERIAERWFDDPADGLVVPVLDYDEAIRGQGQGAYTDEDAQEAAVRLVEACSR